MTTTYSDPFETLLRLQRALDQSRLSAPRGLTTAGSGAFPHVNLFQRDHTFVLIAELPGVDRKQLKVEVQQNHLRLAGARPPAPAGDRSVHRRERVAGQFDRTLTFPAPVDASTAQAEYRDGLLIVTLPQASEARPRTVSVQ